MKKPSIPLRTKVSVLIGLIIIAFLLMPGAIVLYQLKQKDEAKRAYADLVELNLCFYKYYEGKSEYRAYTIDQLRGMGALHDANMSFIKQHVVEFIPFSATDPGAKRALHARILRSDFFLTKSDLLSNPFERRHKEPMPDQDQDIAPGGN